MPGLYDGAGIDNVTFRIIADDGNGDVVWEKVESNAPYCAFGGNDPGCTAIDLRGGVSGPIPSPARSATTSTWRRSTSRPRRVYATQWRWRFFIDLPNLAVPQPAPNTARINSVLIQGGRYYVDFETFGFTPQVPGQHVHFFYDSVPPQQAGMPGSGPWQVYLAGPGQINTSPFSLLTVASRPANASQMCILVANADHSVQPGDGGIVLRCVN